MLAQSEDRYLKTKSSVGEKSSSSEKSSVGCFDTHWVRMDRTHFASLDGSLWNG